MVKTYSPLSAILQVFFRSDSAREAECPARIHKACVFFATAVHSGSGMEQDLPFDVSPVSHRYL